MFTEELAGFHRKPGHKNGKEAIFVALYRVPAPASIAFGNGYAALPIRPHALCISQRLCRF